MLTSILCLSTLQRRRPLILSDFSSCLLSQSDLFATSFMRRSILYRHIWSEQNFTAATLANSTVASASTRDIQLVRTRIHSRAHSLFYLLVFSRSYCTPSSQTLTRTLNRTYKVANACCAELDERRVCYLFKVLSIYFHENCQKPASSLYASSAL